MVYYYGTRAFVLSDILAEVSFHVLWQPREGIYIILVQSINPYRASPLFEATVTHVMRRA